MQDLNIKCYTCRRDAVLVSERRPSPDVARCLFLEAIEGDSRAGVNLTRVGATQLRDWLTEWLDGGEG